MSVNTPKNVIFLYILLNAVIISSFCYNTNLNHPFQTTSFKIVHIRPFVNANIKIFSNNSNINIITLNSIVIFLCNS